MAGRQRLPRQFLLLLTATPVQNSLEDLYHLVELLDAGRLPARRNFASDLSTGSGPGSRRPRRNCAACSIK
jgi:SNF2 family DNA or RNA helicase